MTKRVWIIGAVAAIAIAAAALATRNFWSADRAVAQGPRGEQGARPIPVDIAAAVKKAVPVRLDALGTVTPIASVAIKSRIETAITGVHFADGARVKEGDLLFTLDCRALEAQARQAEGVIARDQAQLEGARRDVARYADLVEKKATAQINLDNARTQADTFGANLKANQAALDHLKVQLTYCSIRAPIAGRMSAAQVKVGNFVRPSDTAPLATIIQVAPIYVSFAVPQRNLPEVRDALAEGTTAVEAIVPGDRASAAGRLSAIDNTVDAATGMVTLRATMPNTNEILWPGTLVNVRLTLRIEQAVVVPSPAIQVGQSGSFVFAVKDGVATVRPVKVERTVDGESVIASGLSAGEMVVTDGQLRLNDGSKVQPRRPNPGS